VGVRVVDVRNGTAHVYMPCLSHLEDMFHEILPRSVQDACTVLMSGRPNNVTRSEQSNIQNHAQQETGPGNS
jgi:hypothetical protein